MRTVTLTAPDGWKERWDIDTTYLAIKLWYLYLSNPDQQQPNKLAKRISMFVGDDLSKVQTMYVYMHAVKYGLFEKLSLLTHNSDDCFPELYFVMKSLEHPNKYIKHNQRKERQRRDLIDRINTVTNNDPNLLEQLTTVAKLFVDGQISYKNKEAK